MAEVLDNLDKWIKTHPMPMPLGGLMLDSGSETARKIYDTLGNYIVGQLSLDPEQDSFSLVVQAPTHRPLVRYDCVVASRVQIVSD